MLFSQTEGIIIILSSFPAPNVSCPNVSCERDGALCLGVGGGGGGGGGHWLYSLTFLGSFGSMFQFACPPLSMYCVYIIVFVQSATVVVYIAP